MIKAVLFDLDGVICDTAKFHYIAWKQLANKLGSDIDEEFNDTLKGIDRVNSLKRICKHIGVTLNDDELENYCTVKNKYYVELLNTLSSKDILPGIEKFILDLKENKINIAVASASKNAPYILEKIGLLQYVDYIVDPTSVSKGKPAPDIFLAGAKYFDLSCEECIGIEDAQAGIDALNSAQIKSIGIGEYLNDATITLKNTSLLSFDLLKTM